jgi:FMN-dependent oxidoreductase (nitrilotriacetate monooxygenase family)
MTRSPRRLRLGLLLEGAGRTWTDWRHPAAQPGASTDFDYYRRRAQLCEAGKLDFIFIADSLSIHERSSPHYLNRFEPLTILSALAAVTQHIGLVATVTATYTEPFNLARQLASLDHISGGRAGWNVVTSWLEGTADNFGRDAHLAHAERYRLAAEHVAVVQGLWDSWEDDALLHDKPSGRFFDPAKLHALNHVGEFFKVKGPLNIARSRQGQPAIFQAGVSEAGRDFAARTADAIFAGQGSFEELQAYRDDLRRRAAEAGRDASRLSVLPLASPIVGSTVAEAQALYQERAELTSIGAALAMLGRPFNDHDFRQYPLDEPFPLHAAEAGANSQQGSVLKIVEAARREGLSLRQVAQRFATPNSPFQGTPEQVADQIQSWFEGGAADGFILSEWLPGQLQRFVEEVLPLLRRRGLAREDYDTDTLRGHLGLDKPVNRHTAKRQADVAVSTSPAQQAAAKVAA